MGVLQFQVQLPHCLVSALQAWLFGSSQTPLKCLKLHWCGQLRERVDRPGYMCHQSRDAGPGFDAHGVRGERARDVDRNDSHRRVLQGECTATDAAPRRRRTTRYALYIDPKHVAVTDLQYFDALRSQILRILTDQAPTRWLLACPSRTSTTMPCVLALRARQASPW